jgi:hypothetical protein
VLTSALCKTDLELYPTLFSQGRFVNAIVRTTSDSVLPIELRSPTSHSTLFGMKTLHSFGRQSVALAPFGLYAHPSGRGDLDASLRDIVRQLKTWSTVSFEWNVRFDHVELAQQLLTQEIPVRRIMTQTLSLDGNYEASFARFDSTTRNLVRRARRQGLLVRTTYDLSDVSAYYEVYTEMAAQKGNYSELYSRALFDELLKLHDDVVFVVADLANKIIGGAWFFRDGGTLFYFHSAMDLNYSRHSPIYAIIDYAIRMAHEEGRNVFNFGGSSGIASLEQFKAKWGAKPQYCWRFKWRNPLWQTVQNVRSIWRLHAP